MGTLPTHQNLMQTLCLYLTFCRCRYADATAEELAAGDNVCIICREEMSATAGSGSCKKLPCNHIFHASCLRSWFQRQQTCPTCRMDVLRPPAPTTTTPAPSAAAPAAPAAQQQQQQAQQGWDILCYIMSHPFFITQEMKYGQI